MHLSRLVADKLRDTCRAARYYLYSRNPD